jgi:chemotaxis protein histidine kinase CheA
VTDVVQPKLTRLADLLAERIRARMHGFESMDPHSARVALSDVRASAVLAGYPDLGVVVRQSISRLVGDDGEARARINAMLARVAVRLEREGSPFRTTWPEPPPDLEPSEPVADYRSEYLGTVRDRLAELDLAVAGSDISASLQAAYRTVHSIKSAAASVDDDVTAWYCHGLEAHLREAVDAPTALVLGDLVHHRSILAALIDEQPSALATLRSAGKAHAQDFEPDAAWPASSPPADSVQGRPPPSAPPPEEASDATLRVSPADIDRFVEQLERIELVHDDLDAIARSDHQLARKLHELRADLLDATRLIGPSRPWGVPAAAIERIETVARSLRVTAASADRSSHACRNNAELLHTRAARITAEIGSLRRSTLGWLFARVVQAAERIAEREGRKIRFDLAGTETPIDRRTAERLIDPLLQLVQNAIAHGIRAPEDRERAGKPPEGTIRVAGERAGESLSIVVQDDGLGVDVLRVRELAARRGLVSAEAAAGLSDNELLSLLFLPGFTTREGPDLLAGRGVGLDLAQERVRRLGGAIRLSSHAGSGLRATIETPIVTRTADVLWLRAGTDRFALPTANAGTIRIGPSATAQSLSSCLGLPESGKDRFSLGLVIAGIHPIELTVTAIDDIQQQASLRALPAVIAERGPYRAAILRADGSLHLALDPALLAARAWVLAARG